MACEGGCQTSLSIHGVCGSVCLLCTSRMVYIIIVRTYTYTYVICYVFTMSTKSWASLVHQTVIQSQRGETGQTFLQPCSYITGVWDYCRAPVQETLSEVIVIRTCAAWKSQVGYKHFMNIVQCTVCCEFFDLRLEVNYPRPTHQFAAQHFTLMPYAASTILYQQDCDLYQYFVCTYIYKV